MDVTELSAQGAGFVCELDNGTAAVARLVLPGQVTGPDHLADVVRDIAAAQVHRGDRGLDIVHIEQAHTLHRVDICNADPLQLQLEQLKEVPMKSLNE